MASLDGFSVEQFRLQANHLEHLHSRKRLNPEQRSTNKLIEAISGQFFIHEQVRGFNEILNKRMRIDMIVKPIDSSKWSSTEIAIGIEVKRIDKQ